MAEKNNISELADLLSGVAVLSSSISEEILKGVEVNSLAALVKAHFQSNASGPNLLTPELIADIMKKQSEKAPEKIEVVRNGGFSPSAKDIDPNFRFRNAKLQTTAGTADSFVEYFRDRFHKLRAIMEKSRVFVSKLNSIESLKQYTKGREVSIIGIVCDRIVTKNGHILATIEDETGQAKVLFLKSGTKEQQATFEAASRIIYDDVIAVKGKVSDPFVMANSIMYPDTPIRDRKKTEEDFAIAFMSDIHVGSKKFLAKKFTAMLKWLNCDTDHNRELAGKIKYMVMSGDLVDGIGIYPNQDRDLEVLDIYKQYSILFDYIREIPDYIHIFMLPGNHDAVHLAEPQPPLDSDLLRDFRQDNVHVLTNPAYMDIHGLKVLGYHGSSLDSIIRLVPNCSYAKPETAMIETLKRRHLSPVYGGHMIIPAKSDSLVMDIVPDILHMGHIHKNAVADYHGTLVVNSGTWQDRTDYQVKQGHMPSPGVLPIYETKSAVTTNVDFNMMA
jgi:DNA polymerase II small subunit